MKKQGLLVVLSLLVVTNLSAAQTHSATLTWGASTTPGVSYNVYRANCIGTISSGICSQDGTFSIIGSSSLLNFMDTVVTQGAKYDYYVTALCPTGGCSDGSSGESVPSNHWAGTIPKDVSPATNLAGTVK